MLDLNKKEYQAPVCSVCVVLGKDVLVASNEENFVGIPSTWKSNLFGGGE